MTFTALTMGCVPKLDRGIVAVDVQAQPVTMVSLTAVDDAPTIQLGAIVYAGSAFDPAGREGLAAATAATKATSRAPFIRRAGGTIHWGVKRDYVWFDVTCPSINYQPCAQELAQLLTVEPDAAAWSSVQTSHSPVDDPRAIGQLALDTWLFEGHPYGRPPLGREGVRHTLLPVELERFAARHYVRANVVTTIAGSPATDAQKALETALRAVPAGPPPEMSQFSPIREANRGWVHVESSGDHWALLGRALDIDTATDTLDALEVGTQLLTERWSTYGVDIQLLRRRHPSIQLTWGPLDKPLTDHAVTRIVDGVISEISSLNEADISRAWQALSQPPTHLASYLARNRTSLGEQPSLESVQTALREGLVTEELQLVVVAPESSLARSAEPQWSISPRELVR